MSFEIGDETRFSADVRTATFEWSWMRSVTCTDMGKSAMFDFAFVPELGRSFDNSALLFREWRQVIEAVRAGTTIPTS